MSAPAVRLTAPLRVLLASSEELYPVDVQVATPLLERNREADPVDRVGRQQRRALEGEVPEGDFRVGPLARAAVGHLGGIFAQLDRERRQRRAVAEADDHARGHAERALGP